MPLKRDNAVRHQIIELAALSRLPLRHAVTDHGMRGSSEGGRAGAPGSPETGETVRFARISLAQCAVCLFIAITFQFQ